MSFPATPAGLLLLALLATSIPIGSLAMESDNQQALPSVISIEFAADTHNESDNQYLSGDFGLAGELRIRFGLGKSSASAARHNVKTSVAHVGLSSDPLANASLGLELEHWGNKGAIEQHTWRLDFNLNAGDWNLGFSPQHSNIRIHTLNDNHPKVDLNSQAYTLSAGYYPLHGWYADARYSEYRYSRKLDNVDTEAQTLQLLALLFLSADTLNLLFNFENSQIQLGGGYQAINHRIGLDWLRGISTIDQSAADTWTLSYEKELGLQWIATLSLSQQSTTKTPTSTLAALNLQYLW